MTFALPSSKGIAALLFAGTIRIHELIGIIIMARTRRADCQMGFLGISPWSRYPIQALKIGGTKNPR